MYDISAVLMCVNIQKVVIIIIIIIIIIITIIIIIKLMDISNMKTKNKY